MSRFLLAVWSFETHIDPNLALACALRQRGHEVAFYAGPRAAKEADAIGIPVFPFDEVSEELADLHVDGILRDRYRPRFLRKHWFDFLLSQVSAQIEDLERIIAEWKPDVLVSDMAMVAPFTILEERLKIRVAVLSHVGYSMVPGPEGPIPGRSLPPRRTALARLRASITLSAVNFAMRDVPRAIDELRKVYGLPPTGLRVTEYHSRKLLLIPSVPDLDYNRKDLPRTVHYVGMCFWPPPREHKPIQTPLPLVVVDEGSFYMPEPFLLRMAAKSLANAPFTVRLIAGKHRDMGALDLGALAPNVTLEPWRPVDELLGSADLVISSGNTESVLSALRRATPVIVVPAILDQTEIAWRVQEFGAGFFIPEAKCTPDVLLSALHRALDEPSFREKAQVASEKLAQYRGAARAVELLEQFVLT